MDTDLDLDAILAGAAIGGLLALFLMSFICGGGGRRPRKRRPF